MDREELKFVCIRDETSSEFDPRRNLLKDNKLSKWVKPKRTDLKPKERKARDIPLPVSKLRELFGTQPKMTTAKLREECDYIAQKLHVFAIKAPGPTKQPSILPQKRGNPEGVSGYNK